MTNVLITGAAGFIGSHLYNYLKGKEYKVLGIDNYSHPCTNSVPVQHCDVRYYKDLLPYFSNCNIVFHLAAQISVDRSIYNPEETISTNILGTQNILELARKHKTKAIFASSSEIYGSSTVDYMTESHPLLPFSPYGASKAAGDLLCHSYHKTYNQDIVVVRNFNTFGQYQADDSYGGVIAKFTKAALRGEPLILYGDGTQERDYMHVKDAVQAYELAMSLPAGETVNFGTGNPIKIIDLARFIVKKTNSKSEITINAPRKGEVQRLCAGIGHARKYGFIPKTDFWADLEDYIEWKRNA